MKSVAALLIVYLKYLVSATYYTPLVIITFYDNKSLPIIYYYLSSVISHRYYLLDSQSIVKVENSTFGQP